MIFPPHNKDCALFEEKINGKYFALHRPSSPELGGNYILSLIHISGGAACVAAYRQAVCSGALRFQRTVEDRYHGVYERELVDVYAEVGLSLIHI